MYVKLLALVYIVFIIIFVISVLPVGAQETSDCQTGETIQCGSNIGACSQGYRECIDEEWGDCIGDIYPETEICDNNIDDDCDGLVDECGNFMWMVVLGVGMLFFGGGIGVANRWTD